MTTTRGATRTAAERLPVARVCVDVPLAHLDRPFDYLVADADDAAARPGVRVRVRFAGQLVSGFLLDRVESSPHEGRLAFLDKVVSAERVLDPEVARLARAVADRYAGNLSDVLRLAVPPRHARVESQGAVAAGPAPADATGAEGGGSSPPSDTTPEESADPATAVPVDPPAAVPADPPAAVPADPPAAVPAGSPAAEPAGPPSAFAPAGSPAAVPAGSPSAFAPAGSPVAASVPVDPSASVPVDVAGWDAYATGASFLRALAAGRPARAVWGALPGEDWPARIAQACAATARAGRGSVVVVADARDLARVDRALEAALGPGRHVALNAAAGPAERYRRFLRAARHQVRVVAGTRAAMFAPVPDIGLVVIWDDGDDLHAEPRAPYPHAREVLLTRAQLAGCAALVGGFARTGEAQLLLETGWAHEITASRDVLRQRSPRIQPTGDDPQLARDPGAATARLPSLAWQVARAALHRDAPVLIQVPRRGYLPSVACAECRTPARCPHCAGPLSLSGARDVPTCRWCARASAGYSCPACGGRRLRASVTGARRTAEELGRAFPGVPVRTSGRDEVLETVPAEAALVIATPGAEPVAERGFGAVLLLDTWALLTRSDLRAGEETMRRWLNAAALARPDGEVVVVADGSLASVQALLRWDPAWFAARELAERRELRFPPAARIADVTGPAAAVADLLAAARLPADTEVLGPVPAPAPARPATPDGGQADDPGGEHERMLLRVGRGRAAELARALHEAAAVRSARKAAQPVRIQVDPATLF